jgi:hypothetical protein
MNWFGHGRVVALSASVALVGAMTAVSAGGPAKLTGNVPSANPRVGTPPNVVMPGFSLQLVAQGSDLLENPSGVITKLGYLNDFPPQLIEPTKTEPDQNLYLEFPDSPGGPTPGVDYGHRFLYQGHENEDDRAYITRINLDVTDPAHRITLLTPLGGDGLTHFNDIDGSTWDPFTETTLFTQEDGNEGGVIEITRDWPVQVRTLYGVIGRGGYEGIHADDEGNLLLIEDSGGVTVNVVPGDASSKKVAKQPNSFVYRFVPYDRTNLQAGGQLYALQVTIDGEPVVFNAGDPLGDTFSTAQLKLHTPGTTWPAAWVLIHDTAVNGFGSFDSNAAAKANGATPFKRPENGQFLPGSNFRTFFFCPTGDTNSDSGVQPALAARGAWGSIFRADFKGGLNGTVSIVVLGDSVHNSFDNLAFADTQTLLAAEDRGDGLHKQLNTLDSVWAFDIRGGATNPRRFIALGRDTASAADAPLLDANTPGFQNEGDNEPTGLHISDGSPAIGDLLGSHVSQQNAHWFVTQQHGLNQVWEIVH